jgi:hypothetical protein
MTVASAEFADQREVRVTKLDPVSHIIILSEI